MDAPNRPEELRAGRRPGPTVIHGWFLRAQKNMENHFFFYGKIHYFDHSYVSMWDGLPSVTKSLRT